MNPLLSPLDDDQRLLLETIARPFLNANDWPYYQYVEGRLDGRDLDAAGILATLPRVSHPHPQGLRYGLTWLEQPGRDDSRVALTIAGMAHVPALAGVVEYFLDVLRFLVARRGDAHFEPFEVVSIEITSDDVREHFGAASLYADLTYALLDREPATWSGSRGVEPGGRWRRDLDRELRHFASVSGVEDYLDRVAAYLVPPSPRRPVVVQSSPLDLATAFDYFDVVWHNAFGQHVFRVPNAERMTKLAFDVETVDEFDSRLSGLADLLKNLLVPGAPGVAGGHPIERLAPFLESRLPNSSSERLRDAASVLFAITRIRNVRQHGAASATVVEALREVGLPYPLMDWSTDWEVIRARATEAVNVLREEIQTAHVPENLGSS